MVTELFTAQNRLILLGQWPRDTEQTFPLMGTPNINTSLKSEKQHST